MSRVFIYWDNSNIFHEAQRFAEEPNEGPDARYRVRITLTTCSAWRMPAEPLGGRSRPARYLPKCASYGIGWKQPA